MSTKDTRIGSCSIRRLGRYAHVPCTRPGHLPPELRDRISEFAATHELSLRHVCTGRRAGDHLFRDIEQSRELRGKKRTRRTSIERRTRLVLEHFAAEIELALGAPSQEFVLTPEFATA